MMDLEIPKTQVLVESSIHVKLSRIESTLSELLKSGISGGQIPTTPGRDVQILPVHQLPDKKGLSTHEGQARLLHDLASIELQAMELGLRTLIEYPQAPSSFRQELAQVTYEESVHLRLCLRALEEMDSPWGSFPAHTGLWQAVSHQDSLLDRILIVHRYLEGSGLDATETLLRRLRGANAKVSIKAVEVIRRDEVGHVQFGSRWYHNICLQEGLDPAEDFARRLSILKNQIPRRMEPIQKQLRAEAGFLPKEIEALEQLRLNRMSRPV